MCGFACPRHALLPLHTAALSTIWYRPCVTHCVAHFIHQPHYGRVSGTAEQTVLDFITPAHAYGDDTAAMTHSVKEDAWAASHKC